ncbi:DUF2946 family protein [Xaviernesmea oryzae]|nr:DUF2946 family protein [Xaviernesmea oryzae]SEL00624.1 hypothetical protein SAMN04487976_105118 [Xaviernesmea oryzae]
MVRDKGTGGAIAWALVCLLILQGLLGQMAQGAMAAAMADPLKVICVTQGIGLAAADETDGGPHKKAPECPCADLCRLSASHVALPATPPRMPQPALARTSAPTPSRPAPAPATVRGLSGQPRAPPFFS